jgi:hypothetical protein
MHSRSREKSLTHCRRLAARADQTAVRPVVAVKVSRRPRGFVFAALDTASAEGKCRSSFEGGRTRPVREEMSSVPELERHPGRTTPLVPARDTSLPSAASARAGSTLSRSTLRPVSLRSCACIKTPSAAKCRIPQENPAERLLTTARRGTIGAQGRFPCANL